MKCKIFYSRNWQALEDAINKWLVTHVVDIQHTQFSTVYGEDEMVHILFHTLVLFYIPRADEGEQRAFEAAAKAERETELYLESRGHTENSEAYQDFLADTVD